MPYLDGVSERRKASDSRKSKGFLWFIKRYGVGYSMLLPFVLLFFAFVVLPVFIAFGLSFTNYNMFRAPSFVGLQNYTRVLNNPNFRLAVKNTLIILLMTVGGASLLAGLLAYLLLRARRACGG